MHGEKINQINAAITEIRGRDDEEIFKLGVELGRYLASSGETFDRLPFFVQREAQRNKDERIREKNRVVSELFRRLFFVSCVLQMRKKGSITFDANNYWSSEKIGFDDDVEAELFVRCNSVQQEDEEQDFDIEYEVIGDLADLFDKFELRKSMTITAYNLNSSSSLKLATEEELRECLGRTWLGFDRGSSLHDEEKFDEFFAEVNKITLFTQMKYSTEMANV